MNKKADKLLGGKDGIKDNKIFPTTQPPLYQSSAANCADPIVSAVFKSTNMASLELILQH